MFSKLQPLALATGNHLGRYVFNFAVVKQKYFRSRGMLPYRKYGWYSSKILKGTLKSCVGVAWNAFLPLRSTSSKTTLNVASKASPVGLLSLRKVTEPIFLLLKRTTSTEKIHFLSQRFKKSYKFSFVSVTYQDNGRSLHYYINSILWAAWAG